MRLMIQGFASVSISVSVLVLAGWCDPVSAKETAVSKRIRSIRQLLPLKKITVGPDDQYHGSVDIAGTTLVFTRKTDLVPHLCKQDLKSGEVTDFLPLSADSQQAAIGPTGQVAFTYYRFQARGDICYRPLIGEGGDSGVKPVCLASDLSEGAEEHLSPFWWDAESLGYVSRKVGTLQSEIVVQNLRTQKRTQLLQGAVWSPAMIPGGKYLFYNELEGSHRQFKMIELATKQVYPVRLALPGISGFPAVSDDESQVYFSHYLNDTNGDNIIDGNDHSVIFRIPIQAIRENREIFPEQLTSAEENCSFPRPHGNEVYVTCAFEGGLDVYSMPSTGTVPATWGKDVLENAHRTARTYHERILILNALRYRFPDANGDELDARLFSNHFYADDMTATDFYRARRETRVNSTDKNLYRLVGILLRAREQKKRQLSEEVNPAFEADIESLYAETEKISGASRFRSLVQGMLESYLNRTSASAKHLREVNWKEPAQAIERVVAFDLANWTLPKIGAIDELPSVYVAMMRAKELSGESRIYYAFHFLRHLHERKLTVEARRITIEKAEKDLSGSKSPVLPLLRSELLVLKILSSESDVQKMAVYRELGALMEATKNDYFLRKALYIRAILNFAESADFKYLSFVASNWLRYTPAEETEFGYARDVYVGATLDQAYDRFARSEMMLAAGYFYESFSFTDDLESHYGYVQSMVRLGQREKINGIYENVRRQELTDDNFKFVEATLALVDARPSSPRDTGHLNRAIDKIQAMEQDRNSPIRYLMLGYSYAEKLRREASAYQFDRALFDQAHRALMLAYDLGRENERIAAAALGNLALLHQRVQNHAIAVRFFERRKPLGFLSDDERAAFAWFYSRSLFYSYQHDAAAEALAELPEKVRENPMFREREAFYWQTAERCERAVPLYRKIFAAGQIQGDRNLAKVGIGFGYCLFKLNQSLEAIAVLQTASEHADKLQTIPRGGERLIASDPRRLHLVISGLLGRLGPSAERIAWLERRKALLASSGDLYDDIPTLQIQNFLQLAALRENSDLGGATRELDRALSLAEKTFVSEPLSHAVYQTVIGVLAFGIQHPNSLNANLKTRIRALAEKAEKTYSTPKVAQPTLEAQTKKVSALRTVFGK